MERPSAISLTTIELERIIMNRLSIIFGFCLIGCLFSQSAAAEDESVLRLGLIGLDTSHVIAFTSMLNDPNHQQHVPGARVIVGYKGGSPDIEQSISRVDGYTEQLVNDWGVEIVDSIADLCERVDAVLITSLDGRPHLAQAREVIEAGKPMFIDKPLAGSLADAIEIARLARDAGVPWFGGSSLRWWSGIRDAVDPEVVGDILGCDAYSPCYYEPNHPDLFWYGVHGVETLYAAMGPGCQTVTRIQTGDTDLVVGVWDDGRIGTFRGTRAGRHGYGATIFGSQAIVTVDGHSYKGMIEEIVRFFQTGEPPIGVEEMLETLAFMEAADESIRQGGATVPLPCFALDD